MIDFSMPLWCLLYRSVLSVCITLTFLTCQVLSLTENGTNEQTVSVRLEGTLLDGVVEVSSHVGVWSYVQASGREWSVGSVSCKQLGLGPLSFVSSVLGPNDNIYEVTCNGTERSLSDCFMDTKKQVYSRSVLRVGCLPARAKELDVVLVKRHASLDEGYVYTYINSGWGSICSGGSHHSTLCRAVCKQLNYTGCDNNAILHDWEIFTEPAIENVICPYNSSALTNCSFGYPRGESCSSKDFLKIACHNWETYSGFYNVSDPLPDYNSPHVPRLTRPPVHDTYRTTFYIIALVAVTGIGMFLYVYRKNSHGTQRIFLGSSPPNQPPAPLLTPGDTHYHFCVINTNQSTVMYHPPSNGNHVQYDPPPPIDDPELPTYEEAVALARNGVGTC